MTEKNRDIFIRILIGAVIFWLLAFAADIFIPWITYEINERHPSETYIPGHGGLAHLMAYPICGITLIISYIVLRVKSQREKKRQEAPSAEDEQKKI